MNKVCIIGGGAGGLMAACNAAKNGARVTLFEGNSEVGKKILRTGNGKCNFSNLNLSEQYYNSDSVEFVKNALDKYSVQDLLFYFSQIGLFIRERNGYLYPYCEQARAIRDIFVNECKSLGVDIKTSSYVNCLTKEEDGSFLVSVEGQKERQRFDKVIVATGGKAGLLKKDRENGYDLLARLGVNSSPLYPGLTKITCSDLFLKELDGVRCECVAELFIDDISVKTEAGEVLFRENGISGICIFILSSFCKKALENGKKVTIKLDLLPSFDEETIKSNIAVRYCINSDRTTEEFVKGIFDDKLNNEMLRRNNLIPAKPVTDYSAESFIDAVKSMKHIMLSVTDVSGFDSAQVTVGGIYTEQLTEYMEVKTVPGLFVVGELINTDGPCGGYNLQWAFTTGAIAGEHLCYK